MIYLPFHDFVFYLFAVISAIYVAHLGMYLVTANFYDIWQHRRKHLENVRQVNPSKIEIGPRRHDVPGLLSVVISAHNETQVIVRCLDSLRRSSYQNMEILVADDASQDGTFQLVRDYILRHPDMNLRVYRMRKNIGKGAALSVLLRR
jgi:biofilm PGA synthesis N-glycosyltransferase PgaC